MLETILRPDIEPRPADGRPEVLRAQTAAQYSGLAPAQIERLPFDLSVLEDEGVLVNVDARGFGLLDRQLDWTSLGIRLPAGSGLAFRPPRCGLLPDRYRLPLLRPATRAHNALKRYSYQFTLLETVLETPAYRFVPWTAFEAFEREFAAAQRVLEAAKEAVLADYEAVHAEVVSVLRRVAADSLRRLAATGQPLPADFDHALVAQIVAAIPAPEQIAERLVLRFRVGVVLLGSEMLAEQRHAREERGRLEAAESSLRLTQQRERAEQQRLQQALWADEERLRQQLAADAEERSREQAVKERLRQLKLEAARERLAEAMSPLEEGARQLHAAVYESALAVRNSLQNHGTLVGASAKRARELVRWFGLMNWQSDQQLEMLIAELEELVRRPAAKRKRVLVPLDQVLSEIISVCYADARALAEPQRMAALEI